MVENLPVIESFTRYIIVRNIPTSQYGQHQSLGKWRTIFAEPLESIAFFLDLRPW